MRSLILFFLDIRLGRLMPRALSDEDASETLMQESEIFDFDVAFYDGSSDRKDSEISYD